MELELELKGQLPGLECSRGPNGESGVPSEGSGGPSEGSEGQTEGSGSSNARGDREMETHKYPVWCHRSSAPTGATAQKG